jgi:hypothetical protein
MCRNHQRRGGCEDDEHEANCFHEKIVSRFVLKIFTADILKMRRPRSDASSPIPIKRHWAIIAVNRREPVALSNYC